MAVSKKVQTATKHIDTLLYTFGGADGAASFTKFKFAYEDIEHRANNGDAAAYEIMVQMQKIVNLVQFFGEFDNDEIFK